MKSPAKIYHRFFFYVLILLTITACSEPQPIATWNAVHVSGANQSGDAHLLEISDGTVILIDTGFRKYAEKELIPFLKLRDIVRIDHMVVTHAHRNHYGGVVSLLEAGVELGNVYFNLPPVDACAKEKWSTGCRYQHVLETRKLITARGIPIHKLERGLEIYDDQARQVNLSVLYAFDGNQSPPGKVGVNDASAVLKFSAGEQSVLFTGDIGNKTGKFLARNGEMLESSIMTAPHHGVESMAPNSFFDRVSPQVIVASVSKPPLLSDRGKRLREYVKENDIDLYVTGIHGRVEVSFDSMQYHLQTENTARTN